MPSLVYRISAWLCHVLQSVPVGTNLGLFHLLWMLLSGRLLASRGAIIRALWDTGLPAEAVRRAASALCYGHWRCKELLGAWQQAVEAEGCWQAHSHHPQAGTRLRRRHESFPSEGRLAEACSMDEAATFYSDVCHGWRV